VVLPGVTKDQYDAVRAEAGWLDSPPEGGMAHVTWWQDGDCHNVDAWRDTTAFEAFGETSLGPAMARAGVAAEPQVAFYEAHEVLLPRAVALAPTAGRSGGNADIVRIGYDAFARGDMNGVLAIFDEQLRWSTPDTVEFGGVYHGPAGAAQFFSSLPRLYAELLVEPERFIEDADTVVALGTHRGRGREGRTFEIPFVHVWTLRAGKAIGFTEFFDTAKLNAALKPSAQIPAPTGAGV
jgi:hypothetical protein